MQATRSRKSREVWLAEKPRLRQLPGFIARRCAQRPATVFAGPAIVEQMDATTVVLPGMTARVDAYLNLILEAA